MLKVYKPSRVRIIPFCSGSAHAAAVIYATQHACLPLYLSRMALGIHSFRSLGITVSRQRKCKIYLHGSDV